LGYLFWIAFILLIIILFFFNKSNITNVLEKTGMKNATASSGTTAELNESKPATVIPQINTKKDSSTTPTTGDGSAGDASTTKKNASQPANAGSTATNPAPSTETALPVKPSDKPAGKAPAPTTATTTASVEKNVSAKAPVEKVPTKTAPAAKTATPEKIAAPAKTPVAPARTASVYFVKIDSDGKVLRQQVTREIPKSDSPLSETLEVLFRGTSSAEASKGLRSLIPAGTKLLSATVKDGVATVNVSEEFQFNQYGIEGSLGQLAQVVFTATSYPTVSSVQFLIEGQRREYLGAEGVWIGTPLSREKF
jgi:spore germination protein GerM